MGAPGYTMRYATLRRATPDYAPPEMLTGDLPDLVELRKSEKIDVYAAASVIFELACGLPPFELEGRAGESLYRIKMDEPPRRSWPRITRRSIWAMMLMFEPEIAAVATEASLDVTDAHDELSSNALSIALMASFARGAHPAFASGQEARPSAEALRDALGVLRALRPKCSACPAWRAPDSVPG
ncbi:MAG: hypothetical protein ACLTSX_05145 [Collinsella sp.]